MIESGCFIDGRIPQYPLVLCGWEQGKVANRNKMSMLGKNLDIMEFKLLNFQMWFVRLREVKCLIQGHTATYLQNSEWSSVP